MGVWFRAASKKLVTPILISITVEAINFIVVIQLGFGV